MVKKLIRRCKNPDCNKLGSRSQKEYCDEHYSELLEKSKLYYEEMDKKDNR